MWRRRQSTFVAKQNELCVVFFVGFNEHFLFFFISLMEYCRCFFFIVNINAPLIVHRSKSSRLTYYVCVRGVCAVLHPNQDYQISFFGSFSHSWSKIIMKLLRKKTTIYGSDWKMKTGQMRQRMKIMYLTLVSSDRVAYSDCMSKYLIWIPVGFSGKWALSHSFWKHITQLQDGTLTSKTMSTNEHHVSVNWIFHVVKIVKNFVLFCFVFFILRLARWFHIWWFSVVLDVTFKIIVLRVYKFYNLITSNWSL